MKNYNKQIQVTVELDSIAQSLRSVMYSEHKHADIVVDAIIGRLDANNDTVGMTALYNALNGYDNSINFSVGDKVVCTKSTYAYWTQESLDDNSTVLRAIGDCEVIEINEYANEKLKIRYSKPVKGGAFMDEELWVNHSTCKKVSMSIASELYQ